MLEEGIFKNPHFENELIEQRSELKVMQEEIESKLARYSTICEISGRMSWTWDNIFSMNEELGEIVTKIAAYQSEIYDRFSLQIGEISTRLH